MSTLEPANIIPSQNIRPLDVIKMNLFGRHIIEASAGTGKTYNITRIFIRLLLEKQLEVQKILIVTFTKAATEELKGRIAQELSALLEILIENPHKAEPLYLQIISRINIDVDTYIDKNEDKEDILSDASSAQEHHIETPVDSHNMDPAKLQKAILLLKAASLDLDEASVFTIHSFCQRVIKQSAFARKESFEPDIVHSSRRYIIQEIQDWYRRHQHDEAILEHLRFLNVLTPDAFLSAFSNALYGYKEISLAITITQSEASLREEYQQAKTSLEEARSLFESNQKENITSAIAVFTEHAEHIAGILSQDKHKAKLKKCEELITWIATHSVHKLPTKGAVTSCLGKTLIKEFISASADSAQQEQSLNQLREALVSLISASTAANKTLKQLANDLKALREQKAYQFIYDVVLDIKQGVLQQKAALSLIDHDDTIEQLASAARSGNQALIDYIKREYPYALIDEFQDTDTAQYSIFSACYPKQDRSHMMVMIGDPKQAIYGFRGGDINTYIAARNEADERWSMQHNFRSSAALIDAYNALFYGANVNQHSISYIKAHLPKQQLENTPTTSSVTKPSAVDEGAGINEQNHEPLTINDAQLFDDSIPYPWIYPGKQTKENEGLKDTKLGAIHLQINQELWSSATVLKQAASSDTQAKPQNKPFNARSEFKSQQASAVANEIIRLCSEATIDQKPVELKDMAILVQSNSEALLIQEAFARAKIPNVNLSEKTDIFKSNEAKYIYYALDGILNLNHNSRFIRALSTPIFAYEQSMMMRLQEDSVLFDEAKETLYSLRQLWQKDGVLSLITRLIKHHFKPPTADSNKERMLTNLMHLAELLNQQSHLDAQPFQLLTWLKNQLPDTDAQAESDETENIQRLESDEDLAKIITLHGSKGLEYPIVFIPFIGFPRKTPNYSQTLSYYDNEKQSQVIQIGKSTEATDKAKIQSFQEETRLLYVGITRAIHRCYLGLAREKQLSTRPLCHLLDKQQLNTSDNTAVTDRLSAYQGLSQNAPELFNLRTYAMDEECEQFTQISSQQGLQHSQYSKTTGSAWQLESFSKIAKQQTKVDLLQKERDQLALNATESENRQIDEQHKANEQEQAQLPYRFTIEKSADTGNMLHNVLEDHDFTQTLELDNSNTHISYYLSASRTCDVDALALWLKEVLNTQLPNMHTENGFSLSSLNTDSVLKEPEFYFPLEQVDAYQLNQLLSQHRQDQKVADTLPAPYFNLTKLSGMMHGFIDLLFEKDGKYYVADYKSNYLGQSQQDYCHAQIQHAIASHSYDLQYILYSWSLDRYLSTRIPKYSREQHFGGVYYLFLRGMSPDYEPGTGVFYTTLSAKLWQLLDAVFGTNSSDISKSSTNKGDVNL